MKAAGRNPGTRSGKSAPALLPGFPPKGTSYRAHFVSSGLPTRAFITTRSPDAPRRKSPWVAPRRKSPWVAPRRKSPWVAPRRKSPWVAPRRKSLWVAAQSGGNLSCNSAGGNFSGLRRSQGTYFGPRLIQIKGAGCIYQNQNDTGPSMPLSGIICPCIVPSRHVISVGGCARLN